MNAKILALDIETKPSSAYVWSLFKVNVSVDQIIEPGGMICVGAQWVGDKHGVLYSEWEHGYKGMLELIHGMMMEADAVLTYNGDSFDLPRLNGQFLLYGLPPLPTLTSIDCYKTVKKLGFTSGKLAFVGPLLGLGGKVKHQGFNLWKEVMAGDTKAQKKMAKYCEQDVKLLIKLYERIKPYIKTHPFLGKSRQDCGSCGKGPLQKRGMRRTKSFLIQRYQCMNCGAWQDGARSKV